MEFLVTEGTSTCKSMSQKKVPKGALKMVQVRQPWGWGGRSTDVKLKTSGVAVRSKQRCVKALSTSEYMVCEVVGT